MKKTALSIFFILSTHFLFAQWTTSGNNIYNSNTGYVGIGSTPGFTLQPFIRLFKMSLVFRLRFIAQERRAIWHLIRSEAT